MDRNYFGILIEKERPPRAFVENALRVLEFRARELALVALADWQRAGVPMEAWAGVVPELLPAIGRLQRPSWGHWSGLLRQLESARRKVGKAGPEDLVGRLGGTTYLQGVLAWLGTRVDPATAGRLDPLAALLGVSRPKKLTWQQALDLCITLRNHIAHYAPASGSDWWSRASDGLRPLLVGLARDFQERPVVLPFPLPAPWFIAGGGSGLAFGGMKDDFTPVYLGLGVGPSHAPAMSRDVMVAFRQLLGAADADEANFRKLMARLLPEEQRGVQLGEYLVGKPVGEGGFATVHVGWQMSTGRKAAIKILRDGLPGEYRGRFQEEAGFLGEIDHPGVVGVLGHGVATWIPRDYADLSKEGWFEDFRRNPVKDYIALEFVEGESLDAVFKRPAAEAPDSEALVDWFAQAAEALAAVHALKLVHRDVKPHNLMATPGGVVKLLDFGIARSQDEAKTVYTHLGKDALTPPYAAPEQLLKTAGGEAEVGPAADLYGLCATFYELFAGSRLYDRDEVGEARAMASKLNGDPPTPPRRLNRQVPREVEVLLLAGLQKDVGLRPASMEALAADLRRVQADRPIEFQRPSYPRRAVLWGRRHRRPLQVAAAATLVVGLVSGVVANGLISAERGKNEGLQNAASQANAKAEASKRGETTAQLRRRRGEYEREMLRGMDLWAADKASEVRAVLDRYVPARSGDEDLRQFEWYYLRHLIESGSRSLAFDGRARTAAFSPDGRRLAVVGFNEANENRVQIFNVASGRAERTLDLGRTRVPDSTQSHYSQMNLGPDHGVAFSPDGKLVAATCLLVPNIQVAGTGIVKVWEAGTGKEVVSIRSKSVAGLAVAFSPDGNHVLAGGYRFAALAWEVSGGRLAYTLPSYEPFATEGRGFRAEAPEYDGARDRPRSPVDTLRFAPGGRSLIRSSGKGFMQRSQDRQSIRCDWPPDRAPVGRAPRRGMGDDPSAGQFPPEADSALIYSEGGLWGLAFDSTLMTVKLINEHQFGAGGPRQPARRMPQMPRGPLPQANPELAGIPPMNLDVGQIRAAAIGGSALALAGTDGRVVFARFNPNAPQAATEKMPLRGHTGGVNSLAFSPDNRKVVAAGESKVTVWDVSAPAESKALVDLIPSNDPRFAQGLGGPTRPYPLAAGRWAAYVSGLGQAAGEVRIHWLDPSDSKATRREVKSPVPNVLSLAVTPDGDLAAVSGIDASKVNSLIRMSPAQRQKALKAIQDGTGDVPVYLVPAGPGAPRALKGHAHPVTSLAFAPDGKRLASAAAHEGDICLWDVATGGLIRRIAGQKGIRRVEFSPDGRTLIVGDTMGAITIRPSDGDGPSRSFPATPHAEPIWCTRGDLLAVHDGNRIVLWDLKAGAESGEIDSRGRDGALAFLGDHRLISIGDGGLTIWSIDTGIEIFAIPTARGGPEDIRRIADGLARLEAEWKAQSR